MRRIGPRLANALTGLRVLLTPVFVFAAWRASQVPRSGTVAVALFAVVAASDVWDGRLARRFGSAAPAGKRFDHWADIAFLLSALSTYVALGVAPWWVPVSVAAAFGIYVIDCGRSSPVGAESDAARWIGHLGGVCNYVLVGILACNTTARLEWLSQDVVIALCSLVPVYSAAAIVAHLLNRRKAALVGLRKAE